MQGRILVFLLLSITLTEGLFFSSKCPIKKYKSSKYLTGAPLYVNTAFNDRVKTIENVAKQCNVHVFVKSSFYKIPDPAVAVLITEADIVVGHGFKFELRQDDDSMLCNTLCLSKNPTDLPEAKCFLNGVRNQGITWSQQNSNVLSDNIYYSDEYGYQALKVDIQTNCAKENFNKRQLARALRRMYEEEANEEKENNDDDKKKK